jgi:S-adenosylmethionine:tRNA ribosyltransferase-isomerase
MKTDDFDFHLPDVLIAQRPTQPRDAARLLVVGRGLEDHRVRDLPALLSPGDLLVFNDTRVIPARLAGRRGAAKVEVTLHKAAGVGAGGPARWWAFARPAKKLKAGDAIDFDEGLAATVETKGESGEVLLAFACGEAALLAKLEQAGAMPLPPYIRQGRGDAADRDDYQTVYARAPGAVAAPTAGLHFTPALLAALAARGVAIAWVTLHVGAGTFLPVKDADPRAHRMHAEWGVVSPEAVAAVEACRARGGRVVAVGTTALRLLESAAAGDALGPFRGETDIFILPGYPFRVVERLLTNFHLPRSTLFMLVAAFAGLERMRAAYDHAIAAGYRFYSYGDASLLTREDLT